LLHWQPALLARRNCSADNSAGGCFTPDNGHEGEASAKGQRRPRLIS
jgi:hypothetical protein